MKKIIFFTFFCLANICLFNFESFAQLCVLNPTPATTDLCADGVSYIDLAASGSCGSGAETWQSTNTSVAVVASTGAGAARVTSAGGTGTTTIRYRVAGVIKATINIIGRALPDAGTISTSGSFAVCIGANITVTSSGDAGGIWTSSNTSQATVGSSDGIVNGVAAGTPNISYTVTNMYGCSTYTLQAVTVNTVTPAGITGTSYVCHSGGTATLTPTPAGGGTWMSTNTSEATVGSSTGVVTGGIAGTTTIEYTYTNANGCIDVATHPMTVDPTPVPGSITGTFKVCPGLTTALGLSGSDPGGTWSSASNPIANVGSSTGVVSGNSAGVVDISYTVTNSCGPVSAVASVTVNPLPNPGFVPSNSICLGGSSWNATTDGDAGGVWTSDNTGIATVGSSSGTVSSVSAGSTLITYTVTSAAGCIAYTTCTVSVDVPVTLNPISGTPTVCVGATTSYTNSHSPGGWSSNNVSIATVNGTSGVVTGVAAGSTTITFVTANGCGTYYVTKVVTVNPLPDAGDITGATPLCYSGGTDNYASDGDAGGLWTSSNSGIASVGSASGTVNGVSGGTATITYSVTDGFGCSAYSTKTVTIDPSPIAGTITGTFAAICTTTLSVTGNNSPGNWTSSNTAVATVGSATGFVYGVTAGSCDITFTATNTCGSTATWQTVTVNAMPNPGTITGTLNVCVGSTTALSISGGDGGGVWTSGNISHATVGSATGIVTGIVAFPVNITYTATNGCGSLSTSRTVTVNSLPNAGFINANPILCTDNTLDFFITYGDAGGVWSSSNPSYGTIDPTTGVARGIAVGVTNISYTVTNASGCIDYVVMTVTVNLTNPGTITPVTQFTVCPTSNITLENTTGDPGLWSSSNPSVASIGSADGILTGVDLAGGVVTITYTVLEDRCPATATHTVQVLSSPVLGSISGPNTLSVSGSSGSYSISVSSASSPTYVWTIVTYTSMNFCCGTGSGGSTTNSAPSIQALYSGNYTPIYVTVTDGTTLCPTTSAQYWITTTP